MLSHPPNATPQLCPAELLKRASSTASCSSKVASGSTTHTHNRMMSLEHDPSYMSSLKTLHAKIGAESTKQRRRSLRSSTPIAGASPRLGAHLALPGSPYATSTFYDSEDDDPDTQSDSEAEEDAHDAASSANSRRSSFVAQHSPSIPLASPTFSTAPSTPRTPSGRRPGSRDSSSRRRSLLVPEAPRSPTLPRGSFSGTARRDDWQSSFTGLVDVQRAATATRASIDSTSATAAAAAATHSSSGAVTPLYNGSASGSTSRAASPIAEQAASHPTGSPLKSTFIKTRRTFSAMPSSAHASQSRSRRAESAPPPRPEALAVAADGSEAARMYTPSAQPALSTILSVAPQHELADQRLFLTAAAAAAPGSSKRSASGASEADDAEAAAVQKSYALRTKLQAWSLGIRFSALRARRKWNAATGHHE